MLRRACVAAFGAAVVLAAGCATQETSPEPETTPYDAGTPETAPVASAEEVVLKETAPLRYVVKKGDTLWSIANMFLRDSWQWPELWYVNPKVKNPHLIYPGDELFLYYVDGQPQLARAGEGPSDGVISERGKDGGKPAEVIPPGGLGSFTPAARQLPLDQAIYAVPADQIRGFLQGPRVIDEDELDDAGYIVDFEEKQLLGAADSIAYALDLDQDAKVGTYQVVRRSKEYEDPDDGDTIGYEVSVVAEAEVRAYGDPSTIYITRSFMEARIGDLLLAPETEGMALRFMPHSPGKEIDGKIISVYNGMNNITQYQIVTLNRGKEHGLEPGHVLNVWQAGRKSKDPDSFFGGSVQLPDQKAGTLMVFKVGDRVSHALVMSATRAIHLFDRVEKPEHAN
ncbi:MAG: LysM peptidoglycan-binding domain-containing protein [Gammaproteobacteria bacterium]